MRRAGNSSKAQPLWQKGLSEEEILQEINGFVNGNICYERDKIIGFPGTVTHPLAAKIYGQYLRSHSNNIGMHTNKEPGQSEVGFCGTQEAERQVIAMAADLMGADSEEVDGYISSGGTEANIVGCWIGRDFYQGKPAAIVSSFLAHYSIVKAANLLGIGTTPKEDGGLHLLGTDEKGRVLVGRLEERLRSLAQNGVANIIVVGNAGTTMLGSVDDIPAMNLAIARVSASYPRVNIHFHVDAAMGGFIVPFLPALPPVGFSNARVSSLTIDVHKMGLAPYGSGIILARRGFFENVRSVSPYIPGGDTTFCGSRAGAMALSCWAVMKSLGKDGYAENVRGLMSLVGYARERFEGSGIEIFGSDINIVAVKKFFPDLLNRKYITHIHEDFPSDLAEPFLNRRERIWNLVVMGHTTQSLLDELFSDLCGAEIRR